MDNNDLWEQTLTKFRAHLKTLPDKPEETAESTLKALWFAAAGEPKSAKYACDLELPSLHPSQQSLLVKMVEQRMSGIPLAHLTGRQQFMGVELLAGPEALVPRKETELLGKMALNILHEISPAVPMPLKMIDVCTGAGNLAVALTFWFPNIQTYAADLSKEAVELAKKNVALHHLNDKVTLRVGDLLAPFETADFYGQVDLLLCNPPYISSAKVPAMPEEISAYEPRLAFDGGPFGIKILNRLIKDAPRFLKSGGWLAFEVGLGQGTSVLKRLELNSAYYKTRIIKDIQNNIRAIAAVKK